MKKISIIIVTYNSEKDIFDCVDSIKTHADIPLEEIELIIVDNNSREPQPMFKRLRKQWGEDIICIENQHNGGYGQGNNVGIRRATAPIVLIMNPDVRMLDPFLQKPTEAFISDQKLVMFGMKQMLTSTQPSTNSFWCTIYMNGYLRTILTAICNRRDWFLPRYMYLSGSCFFVRKSMFEEVGLFDEQVFMYGEESDIHYRLTKRFGTNIIFDPSIRYIHLIAERRINLAQEEKLLEIDLFHHQKKGFSHKHCLKNYLRINNLLLLRSWVLRNKNPRYAEDYTVLKQFRQIILNKIHAN